MRIWRRLWRLAARYRWRMALAMGLGFATVGSSVGLMMTAAFIIAMAALQPSIAELQVAIVGVRFFGISRGVFRYLERLVSHDVNLRLLARVRVWFYERLEPLAPARLQAYRSGDLLQRVVGDVEQLEDFYVRVVAPPVVAVAVALLMCGILALFSPRLAPFFLLVYGLAGGVMPLLWRRLGRDAGQRLVQLKANLQASVVNVVQGLADLVVFEQVDSMLQRLMAEDRRIRQQERRLLLWDAVQHGVMTWLVALAVAGTLAVAVPLVEAGKLSGVDLAVVALGVMAAFEAVMPLPSSLQSWEQTATSAQRLFEIIDAEALVVEPAQPLPAPAQPHVRCEHVSFRYEPQAQPALLDVSLDLPPGRHVAVVGHSGAGKSTLFNLLLRFWSPEAGSITLNGQPLTAYASEDVRRLFAVVSQETHLFHASVRENLLLARPQADKIALEEAARQAQILSLIRSLPQGWDTNIGERGLQLSGGERQRLAIARAILQDAPIWLLDEPLAHLDSLTAAAIWQELQPVLQGRSVLLLTHQLLGLDEMDEVLVLRDGQVIGRGTHEALWASHALYRQMWAYSVAW